MNIFDGCAHLSHSPSALVAEGYPVSLRALRSDGAHILSYRLVCAACRQRYREEGVVLEGYHDAVAWLGSKATPTLPVI